MTDSRLQQLKRAWEASRSTAVEAAYLGERVRVGELSQERLEIAAYCAHAAALSMLGEAERLLASELHEFMFGLWRVSLHAYAVANLAVAKFALPAWESSSLSADMRVREGVEAADECLRTGSADSVKRAHRDASEDTVYAAVAEPPEVENSAWHAAQASHAAATLVEGTVADPSFWETGARDHDESRAGVLLRVARAAAARWALTA